MGEAETGQRAGRKEWLALAVLALPTLLVSLDTFVMLLALPHLSEGLGAGSTEQLWIMDVYGFMVAGFMVTMGTLGDRIGRRKLLLIGAAAFGICSILAAYSSSPLMLIVARAALGIAGATLAPSTLSLIMVMFHDRRQRATAVGIWAGVFTVGAIIGPLVGGAMLDHFWWGSVFLLGVPAMVVLLAVGRVLLPEYRDVTAGRLDLTSVAFSLAAILPIIYGLKEIARLGWRPVPIAVLVFGLVMGWIFLRRQRRLADPLVDLGLFRHRGFSVTLTGMLMYSMLSGGTMVFIAQYFQLVAGLSPLRAGLALVPGMVAAIIGFQVAPLLARRIRPAFLFAGGLAVSVCGMLIVTQASATDGLVLVMIGFAVTSIGAGPLVSLGTNIVIGAAPPEKAGSASGIAQTGNEFGYALGIAVLGSIGAAAYRAGLPADTIAAARDSITSALAAAQELPGKAGADLVALAQQAFTSSLHTVALVSGVLLAAIALLILARLRHLPRLNATQEEEQPVAHGS
ncbi:MFS transporter [Tenggerimyces flavus]|uniref:MFS transporter n=1 Tax=Tenggerimyces flavus TaxID=1708749 RepID=A0ABV7YAU1_9ACTN|nr:MFS transporter [Tenggerimyces flavus]MBM7789110.1 DHA2 family multidrug resistance protein-like MFS transporter [Tenggerimyces flavus]